MSPHVTRTRCGPHLACRDTSKQASRGAAQGGRCVAGLPIYAAKRPRRLTIPARSPCRGADHQCGYSWVATPFGHKHHIDHINGPHAQQRPQAPAPAQLLGGLLLVALHTFIGLLVLVLPRPAPPPPFTTTIEGHHGALAPQHFCLVRAGP